MRTWNSDNWGTCGQIQSFWNGYLEKWDWYFTLLQMAGTSHLFAEGYEAPIKSIGNSTTTPRDLENNLDVQIILMALAESVAARLRKHGFKCKVVSITIRDNGLYTFSRQKKLERPTDITNEIMTAAYLLFKENYNWNHPIRSLGIRAENLVLADVPVQLDLFKARNNGKSRKKWTRL